MRLFKTKEFARSARKERVSDKDLTEAVERAEAGLIDGVIGKFLIKQRIARPGQGRRGGHRAIIVHVRGELALMLHLFPKNAKGNLTRAEEDVYREAAKHVAELDDANVEALVEAKEWIEIEHGKDRTEVPERSASERPSGDEGARKGRRGR